MSFRLEALRLSLADVIVYLPTEFCFITITRWKFQVRLPMAFEQSMPKWVSD